MKKVKEFIHCFVAFFILCSSSFSAPLKAESEMKLENNITSTDEALELNFLLYNVTDRTSLPKSFYIPEGYWERVGSEPDNIENRNERILAANGLNIYDGATWQMAVALLGKPELASQQTRRLLSGKSGDLNIRASASDFQYGDNRSPMEESNAFFFRMISDEWALTDPMTKETVSWMDWKPILGENAWAALLGPLQVAYVKYQGNIPFNSKEIKLALSILPALKAMQSPIGGVYHSTWGVWGKDPHDISTENNISLYAGLRMLKEALSRSNSAEANAIILDEIDPLLIGIEEFVKNYCYDSDQGVLVQGGNYQDEREEKFIPAEEFAVDVQTWGIAVFGPEKIDEWFGSDAARQIWENTKKRAGYFLEDEIQGVGYTDGINEVLSAEWTLGAILMARELGKYYQDSQSQFEDDAQKMRNGIESLKEVVEIEGIKTIAFDYANKRYEIPFGWWANRIPSLTSTAWAIMIDRGFNPFILGGGGF